MSPLNEEDKERRRLLRDDYNIFQRVDEHLLHPAESNGIVLNFCGDCDQAEDMVGFHEKAMAMVTGYSRIHRVGLNGGAILIPSYSPVAQLNEGLIMLAHSEFAVRKKGIRTIVLHIHAPCGAAMEFGLTVPDSIHLLVEAKRLMKERCPSTKVVCFVHIDKGERGKKTYFVSPKEWRLLQMSHSCPEILRSSFHLPSEDSSRIISAPFTTIQ